MKLRFRLEQQRILGVKTENDTHAELVQTHLHFRRIFVSVLRQKPVIELAYELTGRNRKLRLCLDCFRRTVNQKAKAVELCFKVFECNRYR